MMDSIDQCLTESNVNFIRIDGNTRSELRDAYIERFQNKKSCQVAVLSLKGKYEKFSADSFSKFSFQNEIQTVRLKTHMFNEKILHLSKHFLNSM